MVLLHAGRGSGSRGEEEEEIGRKRLGKYEVGRTLGEGNFGKVKYARNVESGESFAIKILEKNRIVDLNITDQIKREIGTLKLLKHPNVVRLHEVLASKAKIYMVLEYVNGGELFDRILENVLIDESGLIKITDFGLSALPQHFRDDGLLHTTCGSPNYVAPEILSNKGYDGATSDTWSCGVILYVILTGYLPFDDRNLAVLYQKIFKGDAQIPKWLSPGAKNLIKRILDPNPHTRISMHDIKDHGWFKQDYTPLGPDEEDCACTEDELSSVHDITTEAERDPDSPYVINAFQLIGMSSCLDLSGFFEKEVVSERNIRFTSNHCPKELLERIEHTVVEMGFHVQKKNGKLKVTLELKDQKAPAILSVAAEVFEISPAFYVVELRKTCGDSTVYRELCAKLSNELGVSQSQVQLNDCGLQTAG
ncbi:CBL-interacting serine/threonine-protein kinase 1-like isoform X2 [Salvia miltiorrhiza]|uniref:CBL-interacting serine/threonine-protein kinase 1-like isoform X2 n=1 Tax=Salvia miltiorrhiza TaxID=226208 RepID=UPI0025AC60F7|nr:CBL-interacting serine/threonine-protein kinase 1-like isoform X2 [Salvia miltiorrhiza]